MEAKVIAGLVGLIAAVAFIGWAMVADYDAGKHAGENLIQTAWDKDKAAIQATADAAIAAATKQRDDALTANEAISNDYQTKLNLASADAAKFASRLRNAEASIAANSRAMSKAGSNTSVAAAGAPSSADQLGQLVTLVTGLRTECKANSDQLDALIGEVSKQL